MYQEHKAESQIYFVKLKKNHLIEWITDICISFQQGVGHHFIRILCWKLTLVCHFSKQTVQKARKRENYLELFLGKITTYSHCKVLQKGSFTLGDEVGVFAETVNNVRLSSILQGKLQQLALQPCVDQRGAIHQALTNPRSKQSLSSIQTFQHTSRHQNSSPWEILFTEDA